MKSLSIIFLTLFFIGCSSHKPIANEQMDPEVYSSLSPKVREYYDSLSQEQKNELIHNAKISDYENKIKTIDDKIAAIIENKRNHPGGSAGVVAEIMMLKEQREKIQEELKHLK